MLEVPIEGLQDEAEGDFCPTQQLEPSLRTARSTAVHHTLGILMPSRNQIQADPAAKHTHDCLLGRRERVTVRAGLTIPRRLHRSSHVGCLAVAGSLTYHTVWPQSGRSSTRVMSIARASMSVLQGAWARRSASLACAPVTPLCCGLFFLALYDASYSLGLLHDTYAAAPIQPISFFCRKGFAKLSLEVLTLSFDNFYASSRPKPPTPRTLLPRESTPDARNLLFASTAEARVLLRGVERAGEIRRLRWKRSDKVFTIKQRSA